MNYQWKGDFMIYRIAWRNRTETMLITRGISRYSSLASAERQVKIWQAVFPLVTYYIEPLGEVR